MSYEMYEDFKETMVKTIKTELAAKTANNNQSSDNDLSQRLEQIVYTEQERHQAIIIQLAGRLESIEQNYMMIKQSQMLLKVHSRKQIILV